MFANVGWGEMLLLVIAGLVTTPPPSSTPIAKQPGATPYDSDGT